MMVSISLTGFREHYFGTVVGYTSKEVVICWDGNKIGTTQNILPGRLLKVSE